MLHYQSSLIPCSRLISNKPWIPNTKDIQNSVRWLREHSPFDKNPSLSSLSIGIVTDARVNCNEAFQIGVTVMKEIIRKKFDVVEIHIKTRLYLKYVTNPLI